jgi:hypothetical protein
LQNNTSYLSLIVNLQYNISYEKQVKPEAATAVIELLMMGGRTPETC